MKRADRRLLYAPFIIAAIAVIIWYAIWRHAAGLMREGVADFVHDEAEQGYAVALSPMKAGGFPFFLRGEMKNASITRGDFSYSAERIFLDALFYQPDRLIISPSGAQRLTLDSKDWRIASTDARASIERDKTREWIAKLQTGAVDATEGKERIQFARSLVNAAPNDKNPEALDISLRLFDARFTLAGGAFSIKQLDAAASLVHADSGPSRLILHGAEARVEDALVALKGEIAPDPQGRAQGVLNAEIDRPTGLVRALEKAGTLSAKDARTAEAGVALLAAATGGKLRAPIVFKNGDVRLAGFKIAKAPEIGAPAAGQP